MKKSLWIAIASILIAICLAVPAQEIYAASAAKATAAKPSRVKKLKAKKKTPESVTLKWNKVKKASGYQVYRFNEKTKKWKLVKATTATSYKVTGLSSGKKYKFKVRAYRKADGKSKKGKFSVALSVKTNTLCPKGEHIWKKDVKETYEKKWVQDYSAWDEPIKEYHNVCNRCGKDLDLLYEENPSLYSSPTDAAISHVTGECGGSYSCVPVKIVGYIHHDAVGHYEKVPVTITSFHCKKCGKECEKPED